MCMYSAISMCVLCLFCLNVVQKSQDPMLTCTPIHNVHVTKDGEEEKQQPVNSNNHGAEAAFAISKIHTSLCLSKGIK